MAEKTIDLRQALQKLMIENNITASAWSIKARKSRNFLGEYLSGRAKDITVGSLEALAFALDLTAQDILIQAVTNKQQNEFNRIKKIRSVLGLSIHELSRRTNITPELIQKLEASNQNPSQDVAKRISQALKVPLSEITD